MKPYSELTPEYVARVVEAGQHVSFKAGASLKLNTGDVFLSGNEVKKAWWGDSRRVRPMCPVCRRRARRRSWLSRRRCGSC